MGLMSSAVGASVLARIEEEREKRERERERG